MTRHIPLILVDGRPCLELASVHGQLHLWHVEALEPRRELREESRYLLRRLESTEQVETCLLERGGWTCDCGQARFAALAGCKHVALLRAAWQWFAAVERWGQPAQEVKR